LQQYQGLQEIKGERRIRLTALVKMPGLEGVGTPRKIERRFSLVAVIMLTGHAMAAALKKSQFQPCGRNTRAPCPEPKNTHAFI
jgi:hypothetical protein